MGIENFSDAYLRENSDTFAYEVGTKRVSTISFDLNAMVYVAIGKVEGMQSHFMPDFGPGRSHVTFWDIFKDHLYVSLEKVMRQFPPEDAVYFAFDGPTPVGKVKQQRERRFSDVAGYGAYIVPGSRFMIDLHNVMEKEIIPRLRKKNLLPPVTLYSSCFEPGEGEHKIMDYYRHLVNASSEAKDEGGIHCLMSPDADIVMLAMASPLQNIVFLRHNEGFDTKGKRYLSIKYFDIELAKKHVLEKHQLTPEEFIYLFLFFGNDFLPRQLLFNGKNTKTYIDDMLNFFKNRGSERDILAKRTPNGMEVRMDGILTLLTFMAEMEQRCYPEVAASQELAAQFAPAYTAGTYDVKTMENIWSGQPFSSSFSPAATSVLMQYAKHKDVDSNDKCRLYWNVLNWNLRYYTSGTMSVNHDLHYHHAAAPSFRQLREFLMNDRFVLSYSYMAYPEMPVFNVMHQMLMSVPSKYTVGNVPSEILSLFTQDSCIADYTCVQSHRSDQFGRVIQPPLDRWRIISALLSLPVPSEETIRKYAPRHTCCHLLNENEANAYYNSMPIITRKVENVIPVGQPLQIVGSGNRSSRGGRDSGNRSSNDYSNDDGRRQNEGNRGNSWREGRSSTDSNIVNSFPVANYVDPSFSRGGRGNRGGGRGQGNRGSRGGRGGRGNQGSFAR
jgi:hypothetical protein